MTKPKGKKPVHVRTFTMQVRIGLDPEEREPLVKELTQALRESDALRAEAADTAGTYRNRIKEIKEKIDETALTLEQGKPVDREVTETRDFNKQTIRVVDKETKKVYVSRSMTDEDAQVPIPDNPTGEVEEEEQGEDGDGPDHEAA